VSDVIDLADYLRRRTEEDEGPASTFALWGADGERSRFALPLWRAIYLAGGQRGAIVWREKDDARLRPFVLLDLAKDPPRMDFSAALAAGLHPREAPGVREGSRGEVTIYLGEREGRLWYLAVEDADARGNALDARDRENILFLAGECAGLLFLRDFDQDPDAEE
jgi:hypothetical protein